MKVTETIDGIEETFAMKIMQKSKMRSRKQTNKYATTFNEIDIMKKLHHPNIIHLHEIIDDQHDPNMYLLMQFLPKNSIQEFLDDIDNIVDEELLWNWSR